MTPRVQPGLSLLSSPGTVPLAGGLAEQAIQMRIWSEAVPNS
jgi:hypothetical protein